MIVHLLKRGDAQEYTTKCDRKFSKKAVRDADHRATIWWTDVTCEECSVRISSKEIMDGPLDFATSPSYNINTSSKRVLADQQGDSTMAPKADKNINTDETEAAAEAPAKESKSKKAPLPEGWVTPVQFAKVLSEKLGKEVRPQIIYGYVKNSKDFPCDKTDDRAAIVHLERGLAWVEGLADRKAARAAAKAEKEAAKAAKAEKAETADA